MYLKSVKSSIERMSHFSFSAGCGRTGAIVAVDYGRRIIRKSVSIFLLEKSYFVSPKEFAVIHLTYIITTYLHY